MVKQLNQEFQRQVLREQKLSSSIRFYLRNAYLEFRRRTCYFCLAFFSVTLVVLASAVSQSIIDRAPIIFLSSAESVQGQRDFQIQPASGILNPGPFALQSLLNLTRINDVLGSPRSQQTSPRYQMVGYLFANSKNVYCGINNSTARTIFTTGNLCDITRQGKLYFVDQEIEKNIGLGTQWEVVDLKPGEVMINDNIQSQLGVKVGDQIFFKTNDFFRVVQNLVEAMCGPSYSTTYCADLKTEIETLQDLRTQNSMYFTSVMPLKVVDVFEKEGGKFGDRPPDNYMVANVNSMIKHMIQYTASNRDFFINRGSQIIKFANEQKSSDYSGSVVINLADRLSTYLDSNYDNIQFKVTGFASTLVNDLGVYPIDIDWPVLSELSDLKYASMFLGIVLNLIIFVLFVLSSMLLYNLLLVSVETKTYELGVLRVLGLNKLGIISLIVTQSLSYVLPAVIIGFALAFPCLSFVASALKGGMGVTISNVPTGNAFAFGLVLGILIPIVASIIPIKEALKQSLSIAIDQQRSKSMAVKISIDVEGKGIPWGLITFALITSMFGISIYYLLPLALLSFDFALLISIFFWILIGLLVGCIMLSMNIQYLLEKFVVFICFFWVRAAIRTIVVKNLASHRLKNRRTAIMYGLSIAFVIFVWTSMTVQIESADFQQRQSRGAKMVVSARTDNYLSSSVFENIIEQQLQGCVTSHSWVTDNLNSYLTKNNYDSNFVTHLGRVYEIYPYIVGVSPNYLESSFSDEFLTINERSNSGLDIISELYTPRGSQSMIIGQTYKDILYPTLNKESSLLNIAYNGTNTQTYQTRVSAVVKQFPGLTFSSLPSVTRQHIIISLPMYMKILGSLVDGSDSLPMNKLLLKFNDSCRKKLYDTLQNEIGSLRLPARVWDYNDTVTQTATQKNIINLVFSVLCLIVMALSFFSLVSAMTANILEQTKEIAVLRAVGITKNMMKTVYFFEAFTLVFSSCIIGSIVGILVGFTMSMQRALFTDLPIKFTFPYLVFIVMFLTSILCAFLATIIPTSRILRHQISSIIRLTN